MYCTIWGVSDIVGHHANHMTSLVAVVNSDSASVNNRALVLNAVCRQLIKQPLVLELINCHSASIRM